MTTKTYRPSRQNLRQSLRNMWPLSLVFVVTIVYGLGLKNHAIGILFLCLSLVYPAIVLLSIATLLPSINYVMLTSEGIIVVRCQLVRRLIRWSDIKEMGAFDLTGMKSLGVSYKHSQGFHLTRAFRRKNIGWDEIIADGFDERGVLLSKASAQEFKKYKLQLET